MTARVVLKTASRARWLAARRNGLGATDVTAILGLNPYRTPLDVWLSKREPADPAPGSWAARRGLHLERFLLNSYAENHPDCIVDKPPALLAHPDHPHILASLDGLAHYPDRTIVLEVKTANRNAALDWWLDTIPDAYAVQVLIQLAVTGLDEAHVIADLAGTYKELTIEADPHWAGQVLPQLEAWWERHMIGGEVPDIQPRDYPLLNRVWRPEPGVAREADEAVLALLHAHQETTDERRVLDERITGLRTAVRTYMREATALTCDGQRVAVIDSRGALRVQGPPTGDAGRGSNGR